VRRAPAPSLSDTVETIAAKAFGGCRSLTHVTIPGRQVVVGNSAFSKCVSLSSATLGAGCRRIGRRAFAHCVSLVSVSTEGGRDLCDAVYYDCSADPETGAIAAGSTTVGEGAFFGCLSLSTITLPATCWLRIRISAFGNCPQLALRKTAIGNGWRLVRIPLPSPG
jgi:hypothetical protein